MKNSIYFKILYITLCFITTFIIYPAENSKTDEKFTKYKEEAVSYEVKQEFDALYPLNINKFYFFKGDKSIKFNDFMELSKDPFLLKNQEKVKSIKLAGHTTAIVSGCVGAGFLIPGIIFLVSQTNYNPVDSSYLLSGIGMLGMSGLSVVVLIIDLIVTYSFLYKFQFSEYAVKQAVERYNENLRIKLKITPELSFKNENLIIGLNLKLKS